MRSDQAAVLMEATQAFLRAPDADALAATILDAVRRALGPDKADVVVLRPDGGMRIAGAYGFSEAELEAIAARIADPSEPLPARVAGGGEIWDDAEAARRVGELGGGSGFAVPIRGREGVVGAIAGIYARPRPFDEDVRDLARTLAAQAGLTWELLASRAASERAARETERQGRVAATLLTVAERVAPLTEVPAIVTAFTDAFAEASGATLVVAGRFVEDRRRLRVLAASPTGVLGPLPPGPVPTADMIAAIGRGESPHLVAPLPPGTFATDVIDRLGIAEVFGVPIVIGDEVWGFIGAGVRADAPELVAAGPELLAGLASIAATAVARAEAADRVARQSEMLESAVHQRTAELRRVADELRVASEAKTELLTNVSHELRTPLTSILGFAEVLLTGLDGPLNAGQREDVETIVKSSRHLLALIDDLIDISRIEAARLDLVTRPIDLPATIREAVEEVRPLAGAKGVALDVRLDGLPATIDADRERVASILGNLLGNAVKFTPSGGVVRVAGAVEGGSVRIDVVDTGIGIAPEHHELVFGTFTRLGGPEVGGTGLGLPISRELARLHGGDVTLESTLGLGSRFSVHLPIRDEERGKSLAVRPVIPPVGAPLDPRVTTDAEADEGGDDPGAATASVVGAEAIAPAGSLRRSRARPVLGATRGSA